MADVSSVEVIPAMAAVHTRNPQLYPWPETPLEERRRM